MKIVVVNGSPKGDVSVTMQYVAYIQKKFPEHTYEILNVAHNIRKIENDSAVFTQIMDHLRTADLVLWAFPLYYMLVCSQVQAVYRTHLRTKRAGCMYPENMPHHSRRQFISLTRLPTRIFMQSATISVCSISDFFLRR